MVQRLPEVREPAILVLADQPHAPGKRVAAAPGDASVDERVEDEPLRLAEPGHHRHPECGEHHLLLGADDAPGDLAAEPVLGLASDAAPLLTRLLAAPPAAAPDGRR